MHLVYKTIFSISLLVLLMIDVTCIFYLLKKIFCKSGEAREKVKNKGSVSIIQIIVLNYIPLHTKHKMLSILLANQTLYFKI